MSFDKFDVLLKAVAVLDEMGIAYLIGGSFASSFYGWSRSTNDVDILAAIRQLRCGLNRAPRHPRRDVCELSRSG